MTSFIANLCQRKVSVGVGIESLEEFTPLGQVRVRPLEGQLGVDLVPVDGGHFRLDEIDLKTQKVEMCI